MVPKVGGVVASTVIEVNIKQLSKAPLPILVTELGILIEVNPVLKNAPPPILVTELGIVMEVNLPEPANVCSLILVTESGILIEVNSRQS